MISSDDESDVYPLFSDRAYGPVLLDANQTVMIPPVSLSAVGDSGCCGIVSESFDSSAFLCNSTSDDIANYNFLEPLMSISMLDDSGNSESEQMSSPQVESASSSSCRTSYTFDPVSLSIVRCVVSTNPVSTSKPVTSTISRSADYSMSSSVQNVAHNQSHQLNASFDEELDTLDITRRVSEELRRCNISQALFAQAVLGRSQGTLSDLLRKPKPWAQLKSGRETFAKMQQWLMEPEKRRLAYLNVTGSSQLCHIVALQNISMHTRCLP